MECKVEIEVDIFIIEHRFNRDIVECKEEINVIDIFAQKMI